MPIRSRPILKGAPFAILAALAGCPGSGSGAGSDPAAADPPAASALFLNVLPPGSNGNSAGGVGSPGAVTPSTKYPRNFQDQLALYGDLAYAKPNLSATPCAPPADATAHQASSALACNYFKNEGLAPDQVSSTETLTAPSGGKVTLQRDAWGVPFVDGATRSDAMYGFGYASGEDRLWLYDLLRNLGRGKLSEFLGPASGFFSYDANLATVAGYDEDELSQMVSDMPVKFGALGSLIVADLDRGRRGDERVHRLPLRSERVEAPSRVLGAQAGRIPAAALHRQRRRRVGDPDPVDLRRRRRQRAEQRASLAAARSAARARSHERAGAGLRALARPPPCRRSRGDAHHRRALPPVAGEASTRPARMRFPPALRFWDVGSSRRARRSARPRAAAPRAVAPRARRAPRR